VVGTSAADALPSQPQLQSILFLSNVTGGRDGIADRTRPVVVAGAYKSTRLSLGRIQQLPLRRRKMFSSPVSLS